MVFGSKFYVVNTFGGKNNVSFLKFSEKKKRKYNQDLSKLLKKMYFFLFQYLQFNNQ